jgi:hypothetical protein
MQDSNIPAKFSVPWANSAGASFIRAIPTASQIGVVAGEPSLTDGWVPLNALPVAGGGIPPDIRDMNGILNQITKWQQWQQAGGAVPYDATFQTAIGGYPKNAIVGSATTAGLLWLATAENNATNPDTGGAGWISASTGRLLNVQVFTASGTYTPTPGTNKIHVTVIGAGAAGGGAAATGAGQVSIGGSGQAGAMGIGIITAGFAGTAVTCGAAGTGVSGANGNAGGASSFGAFITAPGGTPGTAGTPATTSNGAGGTLGAAASGGSILNIRGAPGSNGGGTFSGGLSYNYVGLGGSTLYGGGGTSGAAATGYGAGGGGVSNVQSSAAQAGLSGTGGLVLILEFS